MTRDDDDLVQRVRPVARSYFQGATSPAHDWHHVRRVEVNADRLAAEYPAADATVVLLSALLHDVGRPKEDDGEIDDHAAWGAEESERVLREHGADPATVDAVAHCVRSHRYSNQVEPETLEAEILSDADNLDALGAVGIARCFAYGGERGSPIHDPSLPPEADSTAAGETQLNHVHKKLLDLADRMYTDVGHALADERTEYVREYAHRFEKEVAGER